MSGAPEEKKIIVDEDWKARVQAEKEAAAEKGQTQAGTGPEPAEADAPEGQFEAPLPPPSLLTLVSSLSLHAMMALGLVPNLDTGKPEPQLEYAKHVIDTIAMLEEKTAGNRTEEETAAIAGVLHELRMGYVAVQERGTAAADS